MSAFDPKRTSTKVPLGSEITSSARGPQGHASSDRNAYFHSGRANSDATTRPSNCPYRPHRPVAVAQWLRPVRFRTSPRRSNLQPRAQELDVTLRLSILFQSPPQVGSNAIRKWHSGLSLCVTIIIHLAVIGWLWRICSRTISDPALAQTASFLNWVIVCTLISAFVTVLFTLGPGLLLTVCI